MIVVSDTTALTNLYQLGRLELLKDLYTTITIPEAVYNELRQIPEQETTLKNAPWIKVAAVKNREFVRVLNEDLDIGEAEAITLATEGKADLLIIDELAGRSVAERLHLPIIGLLGVLIDAKHKSLIPFVKPIVDSLISEAGFKVGQNLYNTVLQLAGEDN